MRRLNTLRVRFALWIACLLLVGFVAFGTFVYLRLTRELHAALDDALRLRANQVLGTVNVDNGRLTRGEVVPGDALGADGSRPADLVRLLDAHGQLLETVSGDRSLAVDRSTLAVALQGQSSFTTLVASPRRLRLYAAPVMDGSRVAGIVQVGQSLVPLDDTLNRLLVALLVGGPLLIAGAAAGGYLLAGRALAPIDTITRTAGAIGADALHTRLNVPATDDEVGRLAATFDAMLDRLDRAFQRERQFTADASHELRTPLAAMQVILGVTQAAPRSPADYARALADLTAETGRLRTLVDALLQLARGEALDRATAEPVDLSTLLADVVAVMEPQATLRGLHLAIEVPAGLVVWGNRDGLVSLFMNLMDNAVKYTERGSVTIRGAVDARGSEIVIADTGIGIAPEHLPQIFNRFYRVDAARSTRGTGLGLAIAQGIAAAHGGGITVQSNAGLGTAFTVTLPSGGGRHARMQGDPSR